jgi:hypothetical protein
MSELQRVYLVRAVGVRGLCDLFARPPSHDTWLVAIVPNKKDAQDLIVSLQRAWERLRLIHQEVEVTRAELRGALREQTNSVHDNRKHYSLVLDARDEARELGITLIGATTEPQGAAGRAGDTERQEPPDRPEPDRKELPPSRWKALAVYEWGLAEIPGADNMTLRELFSRILEEFDSRISRAFPGAGEREKLQELHDSLPSKAETFGRYLRDCGVKRYNARGERVRRARHFKRRDQV